MNETQVLGNAHFLKRQEERESNARSYPRRIPIAMKEAKGIHVTDVEGRTYIDCLAGAGTLALGHNHPVIHEAIQETLASHLPLHTLDITTPVKDAFVEELFASLPTEFSKRAKIQFCGPSGADAVEAAVKLVKTATGRRGMFSFQGAFHGMTHGALSLSGNLGPKQAVNSLMPDVHFLPYPYSYRCPFGQGGEKGAEIAGHYAGRTMTDVESGIPTPAGLIMEMVQGEGGVIPAPDEWTRQIRKMTHENHIPMIVDEVQTGLGRTGKLFAFEHAGIIPDVVVLSKAVGGSLPLSVVVYDEKLDEWQPGAHSGTFRGNQMAMATGMATIRYVREQRLDVHAERMGKRMINHLLGVKALSCGSIGDVRGRGLMLGVEIVDTTKEADHLGSYPAHPAMARCIQQECFKRGLILELGGRHGSVVRFLPPLIVTEEQIDMIAEIFCEAVLEAERQLG
ncbi:aspartate aminotransferase family protein [Mechercharimyces sp. CAU 1602]|uniref:aspartate aminotransferase family protein n=1 Tax=Mechercharimyces sp. CAU 1602 TaxID=2973933 RepID=UPI0021621982|nr:aspartate aminotransferase family protein [Mechercharimyces sp. CAU 1602]MCS1352737.1 aspartate aminotransferase family protein [Mechercharimyces sp. CAU 1602]